MYADNSIRQFPLSGDSTTMRFFFAFSGVLSAIAMFHQPFSTLPRAAYNSIRMNENTQVEQPCYIEVVGSEWDGRYRPSKDTEPKIVYFCTRYALQPVDLAFIGDFTRENVLKWLNWRLTRTPDESNLLPVDDFHARCGNIEIPWATEAGKLKWGKT